MDNQLEADIETWRSRHAPAPGTVRDFSTWLLRLSDDQADRGFVEALLDTTIDQAAFGDSRLVTPRPAFGPLGTLRALVARLLRQHHWTVGNATMFVVLGRTPTEQSPTSVEPSTNAPRPTRRDRRPTTVQQLLVEFVESDPPGTTWTAWAAEFTRRHPDHPKERTNIRRDTVRAWNRLRPGHPNMPSPKGPASPPGA